MGVIKNGKDFFVEWSTYKLVNGKKVRSRHKEKVGPSRQLAEAALQRKQLDKSEQKFFGKKAYQKQTLRTFLVEYLTYAKTNKKVGMFIRDRFSAGHLEPVLGELYLDEITPVMLEGYKTKRLERVSGTTVNRELQFLRAVLNKAVEWEAIAVNPVKKMPFLKEPPARVRYLLIVELLALLAQCSKRIKPLVIIAVYTGMRRGEILGLEWRDIDFDQGIIHVERTFGKGRMSTTKGGSRRDLPMSEDVREVLSVLPRLNDRIFPDISEFKNAFKNACDRANIKDFRFHDLRHTFASHLAMSGVSLLVIKELLGHESLEMTLRYAHLCPDVRKAAIDGLSASFKNKPRH